MNGESLSSAVQFAAHGVARLFGESADLVVAHLLVHDKQQQQSILLRQRVERLLNALPEFLGFQDAQRIIHACRTGGVELLFVSATENMPMMPGLDEVL